MARKYVMSTETDGSSNVVIKEEIGVGTAVDLWINSETPAIMDATEDPTNGTLMHEPPDGGAIFRILTFTQDMNRLTPEEALKIHQELNSVHIPSLEYLQSAKHASMHRTDTLNYFVLISGRLWALTEKEDVLLEPGDALVQLGCMHGWKVDGDDPAIVAAVLIDAKAN